MLKGESMQALLAPMLVIRKGLLEIFKMGSSPLTNTSGERAKPLVLQSYVFNITFGE